MGSGNQSADIKGRILLAEDGPDNQRLISTILVRAGADVTIAEDGRQAVQRALAEDFDLILMDIQMPELDGYAATRKLRQHGIACPVIALTANAMPSDRRKCIDAGCNDFVTKPIDRAGLITLLRTYLDSNGRRRPLGSSNSDEDTGRAPDDRAASRAKAASEAPVPISATESAAGPAGPDVL